MNLTIKNIYAIAENTVNNVSSLMECTDLQRLDLDNMSFGEFSSTNVPTLKKGSYATVNGVLTSQATADGVPLYIANAAGSTFQDVSAAPSDTTLYLCLIPSSATELTYALKACASVYYNAERRGWYETGTQNRVFGECRKVGGAWPVAYKRLYFRPENIESYLKMYSDGLEINARKISPVVTRGRVGTAYTDTTAKNWTAGTTQLFKVRTDHRVIMELEIACKTYVSGIPPTGVAIGAHIDVYLLDDTSGAEIGVLISKALSVPADTSSVVAIPVLLDLPVGSFAVKIVTATGTHTYYAASGTIGLHTDSIYAYPRNPDGNRLGEWGAVI